MITKKSDIEGAACCLTIILAVLLFIFITYWYITIPILVVIVIMVIAHYINKKKKKKNSLRAIYLAKERVRTDKTNNIMRDNDMKSGRICPNCYMSLEMSTSCKHCGWFKINNVEREQRSRRIPTAVKREVWRRDNGRCAECGSRERLEYDHIIPFSKGGSNTVRNVELLCEKCNRSKHNKI